MCLKLCPGASSFTRTGSIYESPLILRTKSTTAVAAAAASFLKKCTCVYFSFATLPTCWSLWYYLYYLGSCVRVAINSAHASKTVKCQLGAGKSTTPTAITLQEMIGFNKYVSDLFAVSFFKESLLQMNVQILVDHV